MTERKKILILTNRRLDNGPRMLREMEALIDSYEIHAVGKTPPLNERVIFYPNNILPTLAEKAVHKALRMVNGGAHISTLFPSAAIRMRALIKKIRPDIIITHEPEHLPYLSQIKRRYPVKIVYNAHEYHPLQFDSNKDWVKLLGGFYRKIYEKNLKDVDLMVNVCDGIAQKCMEEFGKESIVIPNACTYFPDINPQIRNEYPIRMIHHGGATPERKIEYMIDAVGQLGDRFQLDVILVPGQQSYIDQLSQRASKTTNVKVLPPLSFSNIVPTLNHYDVGIFNLPPTTFNYQNALPNKLYEFIQARIAIAISDSPEMKKVVKAYDLGIISKGYTTDEFKEALQLLTFDKIAQFKRNADAAAKSVAAENYYEIYKASINTLLVS